MAKTPRSRERAAITKLKAQVLALLPESKNNTEIQHQLGLGRNDIYYWKKTDPQFAQDWEDILSAMREDALTLAARNQTKVVQSLIEVATEGTKPERVKAIQSFMDTFMERAEKAKAVQIKVEF